MENTEAKKTPKLKRFRKWMKRCWKSLSRQRTNTEGEQESPSTETSNPEEAAMESSEPPPCSPERSAPSEPGSPHNESLMSCLQGISSRIQSVSAELAATKKIPCCEAHPLAFRYNSAHPAHNHGPGRSEHAGDRGLNGSTHREAGERTQSHGTLRSECMAERLPLSTSMEEIIDAELHASAENAESVYKSPTPFFNHPSDEEQSSQSEGEDDGDDLSVSQPDTHKHLFASLKAVKQLSSASSRPSWMLDKDPSFIILPTSTSQRSSFALRLKKRPTDEASQDQCSGSSCRSKCSTIATVEEYNTTPDTLQSPAEVLSACAPDNPENLAILNGSCQGEETYNQSQFLNGRHRNFVSRHGERLSEALPVEEIQCRFCQSDETSPDNPLLSPCQCSGSMKFVHFHCLKRWLQIRIETGSLFNSVQNCEVCTARLMLDPATFDWFDFYLQHQTLPIDDLEGDGVPWRRRLIMSLRLLEIFIISMHSNSRRARIASRVSSMERRSEERQPPDS